MDLKSLDDQRLKDGTALIHLANYFKVDIGKLINTQN